ncbi:Bug family tripartite tricarboxylate transporter substrate binding protein [Tenuibacillus multivorans]|uniref:Putative tricarboxylic transport membrane protein n=1 Tax=Tenuibacillus multivorans TaxID=237069 RepID=A0A1H0BNL4_9BACI|nr:tripartite tricarboxylate transporter substrate-binding protein [Tenuibacillus multivorans]GEL77096.1 tricarboxylic transport TctC [Tenuibacillus multivorans]SDN47240.1 putative tricarboxylic transport membrane protein [Tenuibacillus multivorans]
MKKILFLGFLMTLVGILTACSETSEGAGEDYPNQSIELVAAGSPGGGLDTLARAIDQGLQDADLQNQPFVIENKGGGGGNPARAYIKEQDDDPYTLLTESNRVYVNNIVGNTELDIDDVTPLARMATEYLVWVVREDSEYTEATQIIEDLKEDPKAVQFGVGTVPSNDQMNIIRPVKASGIDASSVEIVAFDSGGDLMTQLLGGHIDVISTGISEAIEQREAGKVRILAVSSPEPLSGDFSDVPTWNSLGIDVEILHWRGLFGPPNMPQSAIDYWDEKMSELVETEEWQAILDKYKWFDAYADSETFKQALEEEKQTMSDLLSEIGLAEE